MTASIGEWIYDYFYPYPDSSVINPVCNDSIYNSKKITRGFGGPSGNIYRRGLRKLTNTGSGVGLRCVVKVDQDTIK